MNFTQLKYAITLANEGNFTKAAEKLYITQPTLSIQIKELEKELNQTLFIRTKKSISLTKEGELFITFARQTLKNYQKCQNDMIIDQNIGVKLKIGLYWMFGYNGFGEIINQFIDEHPYVKCYLVIDGSVTLVEKILNDEIDVAVNILPSITRKLYMISSKRNTSQPLEIFKNYIQSNF